MPEFVSVRVSREGIQGYDPGPDLVRFAENVHRILPGEDLCAEGMFGAIADKKDEIGRITDVINQVMPDASGLGHPRGTDNNRRVAQFVQFHRLCHLTDVSEVFHAERVLLFSQELIDGVVETFRVEPINLSGVHAQRRIDKNWDMWQLSGQGELMQRIDNLLGSAHRERGDNNLALLFECFANHSRNLIAGVDLGGMVAPAISALDLQVVHPINRHRVPKNIVVATADVAAEKKAAFASIFSDIKDYLSRAEDMAGIPEGDGDAIADRERSV